MKKLKLTKIIASLLIAVSLITLNPIAASAEWRQNSNGQWWYAEGNSWATGWRFIEGSLYAFNQDGYMVHNQTINNYYVNSDGKYKDIIMYEMFGFDKSTGKIVAYLGSDSNLIIPSKIDGVEVTSIGEYAFSSCSSLSSITIPDNVTNIGMGAFWGCSSLTNITLPKNLTSMGDYALNSSVMLASITIPDNINSMGKNVIRLNDYGKIYVRSEETKQILINKGVDVSLIFIKK